MSLKALTWVWEHSTARGADLLVLLAIADYAHDDGTGAFPKRETLAAKARVSVATLKRHLAHLSSPSIAELEIRRHYDRDGSQISNEYLLVKMAAQVEPGGAQHEPRDRRNLSRGGRHSYEPGGGSTVSPHKEEEPSAQPNNGARRARRRERDPILDALVLYAERQRDLQKVAPAMWSSAAKAKKELLQIEPEVTAAQIMSRSKRMHQRYSGAGCHALVKHWQTLDGTVADTVTEGDFTVGGT